MAYATKEDLAKRVRRTFSDQENDTATLLLELASIEVTAALGKDEAWEEEQEEAEKTPKILRLVTLEAAARVMPNPEGLRAFREQLGAYSVSKEFRGQAGEAAGIQITDRERLLLTRAIHGRTSGSPRVGSLATELESPGRAA